MRGSRAKKVSENGGRMPGGAKAGFRSSASLSVSGIAGTPSWPMTKTSSTLSAKSLEDQSALRHGCGFAALSRPQPRQCWGIEYTRKFAFTRDQR